MSTVVIAHAHIRTDALDSVTDYLAEARAALAQQVGFRAMDVYYRSEAEPEQLLLLTLYDDADTAEAGLAVLTEERLTLTERGLVDTTSDISRMETFRQIGAASGAVVSLSRRTADPGRGQELIEDVADVMDSLSAIGGFLGALVGPNESMPEQVFGLAFWDNYFAYNESLPAQLVYEVTPYMAWPPPQVN